MSNIFDTPPMGGENVPFRELEQERPVPPEPAEPSKKEEVLEQEKKAKKLKTGMIAVVLFLFLIILVLLALLLKPKPEPAVVVPSPSPSPVSVATPSAVGRNVVERIDALEKQVEDLDLYETDLAFPVLDFEINFEKER